jgi:hypothetical protein
VGISMEKAAHIAAAIALVGAVLVGAGILLGQRAPGPTIVLWLLGVPVAQTAVRRSNRGVVREG